MNAKARGFTLIELMVVVALMGILAMTAIPSLQMQYTRKEIQEALPLADIAKKPVIAHWHGAQEWLVDNTAAGLPAADKIVSNLVSSVAVEDGAVHIVFGNQANGFIKGKILTLRPAVVPDANVVPPVWVCGYAAPPDKMTAQGVNRTTVDRKYLPGGCG